MKSEIIEYLSVTLLHANKTLLEEQKSARGFDNNLKVDYVRTKILRKDSKIESYFTIYNESFNDYIYKYYYKAPNDMNT